MKLIGEQGGGGGGEQESTSYRSYPRLVTGLLS